MSFKIKFPIFLVSFNSSFFLFESLLDTPDVDNDANEEEIEEDEEEEVKPKGKATVKKVKAEPKEEEEIEEEEEVKPPKGSKTKSKTKEVEPTDTDEDQIEKGDEADSEQDEEVEDDSTPEQFFEEVEKITGLQVDVDYGDTDPLSPQGIAIREGALKEVVLDGFLEEIESKFPAVFRALRHANNGGDPAELFTQTMARDYSKVELKEGDDALAKKILEEYYRSKNVNNESRLSKLIQAHEDSEDGIVAEAKAALEDLRKEQKEQGDKVIETQALRKKEEDRRDGATVASIDEIIDSKQLGDFKITDRAEAGQFREFVLKNIRKVAGGKYELATPLDPASLSKALQFQYFQFKKGDLSKIVQAKATTEVTKRLRLRLNDEQTKFKKQGSPSASDKSNKTNLRTYDAE